MPMPDDILVFDLQEERGNLLKLLIPLSGDAGYVTPDKSFDSL